MAYCTQLFVDGTRYVLFLGKLQQPCVGGYISWLCGIRGPYTCYCGALNICSYLLWAFTLANGGSVVYCEKHSRC